MPAVCLLHHPADDEFVHGSVLPPLPALGFDRWFSLLDADNATAMTQSAAVIVVLSTDAADAAEFLTAAATALRSRTPVIVVHRSRPDATSAVLEGLSRAASVASATAAQPHDLWRRLARLLPPADRVEGPDDGEPLRWSSDAFTVLLTRAAQRNDFALGAALIRALVVHLEVRDGPYPDDAARADLEVLRKERQFRLMRDYAAAVIASGTSDFEVRRQYGQVLIELKEVDAALGVLRALVAATPKSHKENDEARGLIGRAHKQRYIDAGADAEPAWLTAAIEEYWNAYEENHDLVWHGINTASLLLRASDDGVAVPSTDPPEQIAGQVLDVIRQREIEAERQGKLLDIWDYATRVEAYIDLGRFDRALAGLDAYLAHPGMRPFEVSSTYRQFNEVLHLHDIPEGRRILDRLLETATRLRAGGNIATANAEAKRFLVRVSDPDWQPSGIPDLTVGARLGTIVSVAGSARTIEALLRDPLVISIEESRPVDDSDCARSLPFVHVQDSYESGGRTYAERGARALVAVIDSDIDVVHEAFLDGDGASRIVGVWDQTDPGPDLASAVPFGRLHTDADIAGYVSSGHAPPRLTARGGHGTHVASIAAGRRCGAFAGGVAPEARLLVVVSRSAGPTGYSEAHLAALEFIDSTATMLGLPVVVNVSQGNNAGAHDGQSSLEIAFDAFSKGGRTPGRIVVKSAGNERDKRGHAKLTVPPGGADDLVWQCPAGMQRTVNLELWWNPVNEYRFQLRPPGGACSEWVERGRPTTDGYVPGQGDYEIELVPSHVDNGDKLLRVQHTCGYSERDEPDEWTLVVEAAKVSAEGDIHAWIERSGAPVTMFVTHHTEEMTLSVPGTARSVISVGAVDPVAPVRVGSFSSFGPTRDGLERPDVCAPGVGIRAALRGSRNGVVANSGTSMAAPHVTGAVALLLSRAAEQGVPIPTATQVRSLLHRNTLYDNAFWDREQGYGVLDVRKLLENGLPSLI